jgi:hemerythrin-like domain-containing protein
MTADRVRPPAVTRGIELPGVRAPAVGLEQPFEMLAACHERVTRMLGLLARLQQHLRDTGCDDAARQAARDVMRYFDLAAPLHHEDEELHVFPPLLAGGDPAVRALVLRLQHDHRQMALAWTEARQTLNAVAECEPSAWQPLQAGPTAALDRFADLYQQHLVHEDETAYPVAKAMLTDAALQAMSADMMRRRGVRG